MSRLDDVAKGVVAHLETGVAAAVFSQSFDVARTFDARVALQALESNLLARCDVVPGGSQLEPSSRASLTYTFRIDLCLRARIKSPLVDVDGKIDVDDFAEWLTPLEEIAEYLAAPSRRRLASAYQSAAWVGAEVTMPWVPSDNAQLRQYSGILRLTYRVDIDQS